MHRKGFAPFCFSCSSPYLTPFRSLIFVRCRLQAWPAVLLPCYRHRSTNQLADPVDCHDGGVLKSDIKWFAHRIGRPMRPIILCFSCLIFAGFSNSPACRSEEAEPKSPAILRELNDYWREVSRSVKAGDFKGYSNTCHPSGVLVSGVKQTSYPLQQALQRWKQGFDDTQAGRMAASVEFRFSKRLHDATTAHETGIFRYASTKDGEANVQFIHFVGLLRKTPGGWKILMEHQKSAATEAEWKQLAPLSDAPNARQLK